jgi:predicted nucleic acid-binding protein
LSSRRAPRLRESAADYVPDAFVVDCSVCLPWYVKDEANPFCDRLSRALADSEAWVPSLWRPEFVSALLSAERRNRITAGQRRIVLINAAGLPLRVDYDMPGPVELAELAAAHALTSYDAVYFELAQRRKLPLATLDAALVKAARAAKLALVTDPSVFPER